MDDRKNGADLAKWLFGLLIAICLAIGLSLVTTEVQPSHGFAHPDFPNTMQQGGPGSERHQNVRWIGMVFGVLEAAFFVGCLLLGVKKQKRTVGIFLFLGSLYAATIVLTVVTDHYYANGTMREIILGFPVPTALMVYGIGGMPLAFVLFYVVRFDDCIISPEDLQKFERLVQKTANREESDA